MTRRSSILCVVGCLLLGSVAVRADVASTVAAARARLGSEAALTGLVSVHYKGTMDTVADTPDGPKPIRAAVDILFGKPDRERILVTSDKLVETTALDGYEGWHRVQDGADPTKWRLQLLGKEQIKRLRANVWENFAFFQGLERRGGQVEDLGPVQVDGRSLSKVAFRHDDRIVFFRFFDPATGRLVRTETDEGGIIEEQGEIVAGGIKFPQKLVQTNPMPDGKTRVVTITFESVTVNEVVDAKQFLVPALKDR